MCNSSSNSGNCCPSGQIFQEKICGNFTGPVSNPIWSAGDTTDYVQGTFEIFVSSGSLAADTSIIVQANGDQVLFSQISEGNTVARSATFPTSLVLNDVDPGETGRYCITLYKRIFT